MHPSLKAFSALLKESIASEGIPPNRKKCTPAGYRIKIGRSYEALIGAFVYSHVAEDVYRIQISWIPKAEIDWLPEDLLLAEIQVSDEELLSTALAKACVKIALGKDCDPPGMFPREHTDAHPWWEYVFSHKASTLHAAGRERTRLREAARAARGAF